MKKIITLGDIFKNIETEDKAYNFLKYIKDLQEKDKEIERLNNIINELETYLNKVIETSTKCESITCTFVLRYLKELKESDK